MQNAFLRLVANDLLRTFGTDCSRVAVVFPNKRARLFLADHLAKAAAPRPVFAPQTMTISQLFRTLSPLTEAAPLETVARLFRLYARATGGKEDIDHFFGWGERLLDDFDDVDKNMAPAKRLMANLADIKAFEHNLSYLTEAQKNALKRFFRNFNPQDTESIRARFLELWNIMYPLYRDLNAELAANGLAYEGALYRGVVEGLHAATIALPTHIECYAFAGFNRLNRCEAQLFDFLQKEGKARFYWDELPPEWRFTGNGQSEGEGNDSQPTERFPNALPTESRANTPPPSLTFVAASTERAQAAFAGKWLEENLTAPENETAIVVCNEALLLPVVHSLPDNVGEANITKGFPLNQTAIGTRCEQFFQEHGNAPDNAAFLATLANLLAEEGRKAAAEQRDGVTPPTPNFGDLEIEACFQAYTLCNRFKSLVERGILNVARPTLLRLLRRQMRTQSIPFHGEPAVGVQVMGMLETRCLNFRHILLLSCNEGKLPTKSNDISFIPYELRREFGLTTPRRKTEVASYYFYRLLARAESVTMTWNTSTDGHSTGEMSRFMTQLLACTTLPVKHLTLTTPLRVKPQTPQSVEKPRNLHERVKRLSPSALNRYLECPLKFYYHSVLRLKEPDPDPTELPVNVVGSIFHKAAEMFYRTLSLPSPTITREKLQPYLYGEKGENLLEPFVEKAFEEEGAKRDLLVKRVLCRYLQNLLKHDERLTPFDVVGTEMEKCFPLNVPTPEGGRTRIELYGIIDRLDNIRDNRGERGETHLRVLDYKTGGSPQKAASINELFTPAEKHPGYVLQTFVYSFLVMKDNDSLPITPALFFANQAAKEDFKPEISFAGEELTDFRPLAREFEERLTALAAEIFDLKQPFSPTPFPSHCRNCLFSTLCKL